MSLGFSFKNRSTDLNVIEFMLEVSLQIDCATHRRMLSKHLPEDIVKSILVRLPVKSLVRFKSVSKSWNALQADADFVSTHLQHSTSVGKSPYCYTILSYPNHSSEGNPLMYLLSDDISEAEKKIIDLPVPDKAFNLCVGHCNGILCLYGYLKNGQGGGCEKDSLALWNPATREFKLLPAYECSRKGSSWFGFGFDDKAKDYKVVRILDYTTFPSREVSKFELQVYSLNANSWSTRDFSDVPYFQMKRPKSPVYVNGALHWCIRHCNELVIISFDVGNELFIKTQLPPAIQNSSYSMAEFAVIDGCMALYLIANSYESASHPLIEIWIMEEYGVEQSWTKKFSFQPPHSSKFYRFLGFWKNGKVLIENADRQLISYDLSTETVNPIFQLPSLTFYSYSFSYVESLVPLASDRDHLFELVDV